MVINCYPKETKSIRGIPVDILNRMADALIKVGYPDNVSDNAVRIIYNHVTFIKNLGGVVIWRDDDPETYRGMMEGN